MFVYLNVLYSRVLVKDITLNTTVLSKLHKTTTKNLKKISINSLNYKKRGGGRDKVKLNSTPWTATTTSLTLWKLMLVSSMQQSSNFP